MALIINCRDLGALCDHFVEGNSIDIVVMAMQSHAIEAHGYDEAHVHSAEMSDAMRGAVKQSSRPAQYRTSKLDL
jgi:predicted small metal-binding protein